MTRAEEWDASIASRRLRKSWDAEKPEFASPPASLKLSTDQRQARRDLVDTWEFLFDPGAMRRQVALQDPAKAKRLSALDLAAWRAGQKEKAAAQALHFLAYQRDERGPWQLIANARDEEKIRIEKEKKKAAQEEQARFLRKEAELIAAVSSAEVKRYRWQQEEKREKEKRELLAREAQQKLEAEEREREQQRKRAEFALKPKTAKKKSKYSGPSGG
jgi:hypothetical protein